MTSSSTRLAFVGVAIVAIAAVVAIVFLTEPSGPPSGPGERTDAVSTADPAGPPVTRSEGPDTETPQPVSRDAVTPQIPDDPDEPAAGRGGFSGVVKTADEQPVEGALVELYRGEAALLGFRGSRTDTGLRATTDDDGVYTFEDLPAGDDYLVVASKEGLGRGEAHGFVVRADDMERAPDITLGTGARIYGIVNGIGDRRVAGARVSLFDNLARAGFSDAFEDREPYAVTETDDQGYYEFRNVNLRSVEVLVDHPEWTLVSKTLNAVFQPLQDTELHFLLREPVSIRGVVVDGDGKPVANATIDAYELNPTAEIKGKPPSVTRGRGVSDERGMFEIPRLRKRVEYNLIVRARGFRDKQEGPVFTQNDGLGDIRITLEARGGIAGRVVGAGGSVPTPFRVRVHATRGDNTFPTRHVATFDNADGSFVLEDVDPGHYRIEADAPGYAPTLSGVFEVQSGRITSEVEVRLTRGASVSGVVVDPDGSPIPGARVTVRPNGYQALALAGFLEALGGGSNKRSDPFTTTQSDGSFRIDNVPAGAWQIEVKHRRYSPLAINDVQLVDGEDTPLGAIALPRGGTIHGRVVDSAGRPFPRGVITCQTMTRSDQPPSGPRFSKDVRPDANGSFQIENVPPGDYVLQFKPDVGADAAQNLFATIAVAEKSKATVRVTENSTVKQDIVVPAEMIGG